MKKNTIAIDRSAHQLLKIESLRQNKSICTIVEELVLSHYRRKGYTDRVLEDFIGHLGGAERDFVKGEE